MQYTHTYTHTHRVQSVIKKERHFAIYSNMDGLGGYNAK